MALVSFRRTTAIVPGANASKTQTAPEDLALLLAVHTGGSATGTVSASLTTKDASTTTATPHNPTDVVDTAADTVTDEWVAVEYVRPGDIQTWQ